MTYKINIVSLFLLTFSIITGSVVNGQETRAGIKFNLEPINNLKAETTIQYRHRNEESMDSRRLMGEVDASTKVLKYIEPGIVVRYMYRWNKPIEESEYNNDKLQFSTYAKIPVKFDDFEFSYRTRYQYSYLSASKTKNYFRNKIMLQYQPTTTMETSFAYELFYNLDEQELDQRRLKLKIDLELGKKYELSGFYIIDFVHDNNFYTYYITGLEMAIKF